MAKDLFLSYTRLEKDRLPRLLRGLQKLHHRVWMDQQLDGGQQWWDAVLDKIRASDAVVLVLTPTVLESVASRREVEYAKALGKPIIPVMLDRVTTDLLWSSIASVQIVDFTSENDQAIFDLVGALEQLPETLPLPEPLPEPPPVPVSYLTSLGDRLQKPVLTLDDQFLLLPKFRDGLKRPREREAVLQLMERMRSREDLFAGPAKDLDNLFDEVLRRQQQTSSQSTQTPARQTQPQEKQTPPQPVQQPPSLQVRQPPPQQLRQPLPPPAQNSGSGTKVMVGILVGIVGAAAAFILLIVGLSSGSPGPNPPGPSPDSTPAVGDACLVGEWASTDNSGTTEVNNVWAQASGGGGTLLKIGAEGTMAYDFSSSELLRYTDANGNLSALAQLDGTMRLGLRVSSDGGTVQQTLVSNDATVTYTEDGVQGTTEALTYTADTSYSCSPTTMKLSDGNVVTTYARR